MVLLFEPVINYIEDNEYTKIWIDALGVEFTSSNLFT